MLGGPRAAYATINHAIVTGLKLLGVPATIAGDDWRVSGPGADHPCFHSPAPGEVLAAGGKLVGSAQRCEKRVLLQHGSILIGGSQSVMRSFQAPTRQGSNAGVPGDGITLAGVLGNAPAPQLIATAIATGFEATLGTRLAPCGMTKTERERAVSIQERYDSADWTWRR
jgi:lipoate-protein ligase A